LQSHPRKKNKTLAEEMFYLFKNLLAARDDSPWVQLIIIVVIVGFSILKAIARKIKATAEQKSDQNEYSPAPSKPKKRYVAADSSYKTLEQLREEKIAQIRAAFGIPQPPDEPASAVAETPQVERIEKPIPITGRQKVKRPAAHFVPLPQEAYTEHSSSKISAEEHKAHIPSSPPTDKTIYELLFSSRQELRNAILYQEILGKPLALRDTL
jgi:cytoskeletal protein RodZ